MYKHANKRNYTLKLIENHRMIDRYQTHSIRLFKSRLRSIKWGKNLFKVYIRVSYGKHKDVFGKMTYFINEGYYENKKDLWLAFNAFTEY